MINILGLDPSFRNFGVVRATTKFGRQIKIKEMELITTAATTIKTVRKSSDDLASAKKIHDALSKYYQYTDLIIAEIPSGSQSSRASLSSGICLGILACATKPIIQVSASEAKIAAVGNKTASKREMMDWAYDKYPDLDWMKHKKKGELIFTDSNEHLADAIAIIHAGIETDQFKQIMSVINPQRLGR